MLRLAPTGGAHTLSDWEDRMALYKLFFTDPRGAVLRRLALDAESDGEVMTMVAGHDDGHDIEIWSDERLVAIFRSDRSGPRRESEAS